MFSPSSVRTLHLVPSFLAGRPLLLLGASGASGRQDRSRAWQARRNGSTGGSFLRWDANSGRTKARPVATSATSTTAVVGESVLGGGGGFRGGQKRAEIKLPALLLSVSCSELEGDGRERSLAIVDAAVAGGVSLVLLSSEEEEGSGRGVDAMRLFEAACSLKSLMRGRAQVLVSERADIAAGAAADGVVLSDSGLPAVAARRMMEGAAGPDLAVLPLIARQVSTAASAKSASAADGADLLLLTPQDTSSFSDLSPLLSSIRSEGVEIPVIASLSSARGLLPIELLDLALLAQAAGASGAAFSLQQMRDEAVEAKRFAADLKKGMGRAGRLAERGGDDYGIVRIADASKEGGDESGVNKVGGTEGGVEGEELGQQKQQQKPMGFLTTLSGLGEGLLDTTKTAIMEREQQLLSSLLATLERAVPQMAELSLLQDALARLSDPFLVVIVGEFNSGKSSFINALLGDNFLKAGVVPTTNEITLIRHPDDMLPPSSPHDATSSSQQFRSISEQRHPDGHVLRFVPAELLKQMNLVDTPGTNVILERQQRLTEEFVPQADLVLFILSADRPLTESEVSFLRYIRQWGKKVVFVLNKVDVLQSQSEVDEIISFVTSNVQRLLGVDVVRCFPVSSRRALQAKLQLRDEEGQVAAAAEAAFEASGFADLELFVAGFMGGQEGAGLERLRLKLDTPLGVAAALLSAGEGQLAVEEEAAARDKFALEAVLPQLAQYREAMRADSELQRSRVAAIVDGAKQRAEELVDATLQSSNIEALLSYLLTSSDKEALPISRTFQSQVVGTAATDAARSLYEHSLWLQTNNERQLQSYADFVQSRWPSAPAPLAAPKPTASTEAAAAAAGAAGMALSSAVEAEDSQPKLAGGEEKKRGEEHENVPDGVKLLEGFDTKAAELLLEETCRKVVLDAVLGVSAAGASASVLTSILQSTSEDLLALALCAAGGSFGLFSLPQRRVEVKMKVRRAADGLRKKLIKAMEDEVEGGIDDLVSAIDKLLAPHRDVVLAEVQRVKSLQVELQEKGKQLKSLREDVQNVGL